ncbi:Mor transcription activator family protein [Methylocaldum sp.]|uniref:Mor transcription activator family protein n=1 Tax=Methylocaldum sp. TaxID=1969727 RepID=UPI002D5991A6|nr:Mor transcription activator family protein [Methylocaldum sp.]HYE35476.1 Mor transcription activator family protein [Methylocaldum sp.]
MDNALLPPIVQEFVEVAGLEAALALVNAYGGTRLWFPSNPEPDHHLIKTLGEAGYTLCARFALEWLDIPKCERALRAVRDAAIVEALREGRTQADVAREYGLTWRQVANIAARYRDEEPDSQPDLFGLLENPR